MGSIYMSIQSCTGLQFKDLLCGIEGPNSREGGMEMGDYRLGTLLEEWLKFLGLINDSAHFRI